MSDERTDCRELPLEDVVAFVDDELGPAAHGRVAAHLEVCAPCATEAALLRESGDLIAGLPGIEPSADFVPRVLAAVAGDRPARPPLRLRRLVPFAAAAAAALLVALLAGRAWWGGGGPGATVPGLDPATGAEFTTAEMNEIARDLDVLMGLDALLGETDPEELIALIDDLAVIESVEAEELGLFGDEGDGG